MEYVYAALILNESGEEINEANLTEVLESAGVDVVESRVKALVAALEDVNIDEAVEEAAAAPVAADAGGAAAPAETDDADEAAADDEGGDDADEAAADDEGGDDDEEGGGEGLGELFG